MVLLAILAVDAEFLVKGMAEELEGFHGSKQAVTQVRTAHNQHGHGMELFA